MRAGPHACKHTGTYAHTHARTHARTQGCRAAGLQGCRAVGLQGCTAAGLHGCRAAGLQGCRAHFSGCGMMVWGVGRGWERGYRGMAIADTHLGHFVHALSLGILVVEPPLY